MTARVMGHKAYPGAVSVPERAREAHVLHTGGASFKDLAIKYNVSESAVRKWIYTVNDARVEAARR